MTLQNEIKSKLEKVGIAFKKIDVYGSQIVVTSLSLETAKEWTTLLAQFATVRGVIESRDDNKINKNTCLKPSSHVVFRTYARI